MGKRTFGGRTVDELKTLRKSPADGANFYLALLDAAPDLFRLAEDFEVLEAFAQSLVEQIEAAAGIPAETGQHERTLQVLMESVDDPAVRKIISSR